MSPRLAAVPDAPRRAIGAVRVSKERDDMVSPELQRAAIEDHCARRGYVIAGWIEGLDESGSQRKSPWWAKLDQGIGQVEAGTADVIVVWRFSRTARQRLRWAVAIDRVEQAGGLLESATEPLDTSTASGRLARGMLGEMAAYEAEVIGGTWREVHARRIARGLPAHGGPRFGYRRESKGGPFAPDPDTGPVLASLYRRYIAGDSIRGLVVWLNSEGIRTATGYSRTGTGAWTTQCLRRVLDSGFGAGFINAHGERLPGAHEPVIDPATWEQYRAARVARRQLKRSQASPHLLSGMLRCCYVMPDGEPCGSGMGANAVGRGRVPGFRCSKVAAQRKHPGGVVLTRVVELAVMDWLRDQAERSNRAVDELQAHRPAGKPRAKRDADLIAREILNLDQQLTILTRQHARNVIPEAAYVTARDEITAEKAVLEQKHAEAVLADPAADVGPAAADLLRDWPALALTVRRESLRRVIRRIDVVPGKPAVVRIVPA